jgi:hypothetical protein
MSNLGSTKKTNTHDQDKEKLIEILQLIVNDWTEKGSPRFEEPKFKTVFVQGNPFSFWTPAGKIVRSEFIASAITILRQVKNTKGGKQ